MNEYTPSFEKCIDFILSNYYVVNIIEDDPEDLHEEELFSNSRRSTFFKQCKDIKS